MRYVIFIFMTMVVLGCGKGGNSGDVSPSASEKDKKDRGVEVLSKKGDYVGDFISQNTSGVLKLILPNNLIIQVFNRTGAYVQDGEIVFQGTGCSKDSFTTDLVAFPNTVFYDSSNRFFKVGMDAAESRSYGSKLSSGSCIVVSGVATVRPVEEGSSPTDLSSLAPLYLNIQ